MSTKPQPICRQLRSWLRANLGDKCLAPLTGTDARALDAAVHIVELWSYCPDPLVAKAFHGVVIQMHQEATRELAYHAIAMIMNWEDRGRLWVEADLPPVENPRRCKHEPRDERWINYECGE